MTQPAAFPKERRHTLYFLEAAEVYRAVYLDVDIDMTAIQQHRRAELIKLSYVSYIIQAMGQVIARHPEVNQALVGGRLRPRLVSLNTINAKLTLDKTINGQRAVVTTVIEQADSKPLGSIQQHIDRLKEKSVDQIAEFADLRRLQKLPLWLGRWVFKQMMQRPALKSRFQGSFTVTSLGHHPIQRFAPLIGSTIALGVGAISERPFVMQAAVCVRPMLTITLAFDHRVIDGALAAEVLTDLKTTLEQAR